MISKEPTLTLSATTRSLIAAAIALVLTTGACSSTGTAVVAGDGDLGHIHDLVIDDNGVLLAATHRGLFRIENTERAVLVGTEQHDLMSMAMLDDGALVASGHPDLRLEKYRVDDRPPFLGLASSSDGGENWDAVDLLGDADFHALVPHSFGLFGAETSGRIWFLDPDAGWTKLGEVEARDLAIDPSDASQLLAPDYDGGVWASADDAATWSLVDAAPNLVEIEWPESARILGIDETGSIWAADAPDGEWVQIGTGPAEVETFYVDESGSWWVAVHGGAISRSDDDASSWVEVYTPPSEP